MSTVLDRTVSVEDLLKRTDEGVFEFVNGVLLERKMGVLGGVVTSRLCRLLSNHVEEKSLGWVISETALYRCFPDDPDRVRRPDLTFVRSGRFPNDLPPEAGFCEIPPDLAVEVVSPNDTFYEISARVADFLAAGTRLVWVVDPAQRTVAVHDADRPGKTLRSSDELTGDEVLPGFRCLVADLFPTKSIKAVGQG